MVIGAMLGVVMAVASLAVTAAPQATCEAETNSRRAVLVELYTSEGCDSCPPADALLSRLKERGDPGGNRAGAIVPLAFHVDYWDRLGWHDRYASPRYTQRQHDMAARAGSRLVYTPQFLRNGADWRDRSSLFADAVPWLPAVRIRAALDLTDTLLTVTGEIAGGSDASDAYVAIYENNLVSEVRAGENAGRRLRHDFVVRRLIGPLAINSVGALALRERVPLAADWKRDDLGTVVFVQERNRRQVIQSLQRHVCAPLAIGARSAS
jgi:hypothetical protein